METSNNLTAWNDFQDVLEAGLNRVLVWGPSGSGKTYAGLHYGDVSRGAFRLVCTADMTTFDVIGGLVPSVEGGLVWQDGAGLAAFRAGGRLVVDECDQASGDVLAALLAICDTEGSAQVRTQAGETVTPAPGFSVVMTTNAEPGDLPDALLDRFPVALHIDRANPNGLEALPQNLRGIASQMVANADPDIRASLRAFMAFEALRSTLGDERTLRLVFGSNRAQMVREALSIESLA